MNAKVYLVGAGPGDVELLTLKAVRALGAADVILLDDLVDRALLQFARPGVRVIEVGKRGGRRSTPQAFIERLMLRLARAGRTVARVKGGDPFVFGRGGEELQALNSHGIEVEVVSGVTAGIAVPAALGIPVTHRDACRGVTLVTGHTRDGTEPDWRALAASGTTLVIYMAAAVLDSVVDGLLQAGMAGTTPAAMIQNGTLPNQRAALATLATLREAVHAQGLGSPAVMVVGDVVGMACAVEPARLDAAA
jgi:uroporphyrin-III C-methyltransferase